MALQSQLVTVQLSTGIDTKSAEPWVLPTNMILLENAIFLKKGELRKRNGYLPLAQHQRLSNGRAVLSYNTIERLVISNNQLWSWSTASQDLVSKGDYTPVHVTTTTIQQNQYNQSHVDLDVRNGVQTYVWEDSRGGIRYTIQDGMTQLVTDQLLTSTGRKPRVVHQALNTYIYCMSGVSTLGVYRLDPLTGAIQTQRSMSFTATDTYDVQVLNDSTQLLAYKTINNTLEIATITPTPIVTQMVELSVPNIQCLTVTSGSSGSVVFNDSVNVTKYVVDPLLNLLSTGSIGTGSFRTIAATPDGTLVTAESASGYNITAFQSGSQNIIRYDVGLASRPFVANNTAYVLGRHTSAFQPIDFLIDINTQNVVAKSNVLSAGQLITGSVPVPYLVSSNEALISTEVRTQQLIDITGNSTIKTGVNIQDYNINNVTVESTPMSRQLYIAGGQVAFYDGAAMSEVGFALFPENIQFTSSSVGPLNSGSYQYAVTYESYDAQGQRHQSAPSVLQNVVLSTTGSITLTIPTLRLSNRQSVNIVIWRSQDNIANVLYRVNLDTIVNTLNDTISYTDSVDDVDIATHEILYTAGGTFENISPPPATLMASFNTRVFLAGIPNSTQLWYSKELVEGQPISFNDSLTLQIEQAGGPITALGSMLDRLVIFKRDRIYYITGEGINNTGSSIGYSAPQIFLSDVGCINASSVVLIPATGVTSTLTTGGLMFQSAKGIYLMTGTQVQYIGAPVESILAGLTIVRGVLCDDVNEVRFLTSNGTTLVYNYYFQQWSVFTNQPAADGIVDPTTKLLLYYNRVKNKLFLETPNYFQDDNVPYVMEAKTAWIKLGDLQGYQRVRKFAVLGFYESPHILQVGIAYNYDDTIKNTVIFDPSRLGFTVWGEDAYWGESTPWGGDVGTYQFRGSLAIQKCESIQFTFDCGSTTQTDLQEGLRILGLTLEIGTKKGVFKLPQSQTL